MTCTIRRSATALLALLALGAVGACNIQKSRGPAAPAIVTAEAADPVAPVSPNRTPDPEDGGRLPLPDMAGVVRDIGARFPDALRNSCQEHGGSWEFLDRVVDELRRHDTRWGYNWKRGHVGDPSMDVVDYHWGPGGDEGSTQVYIIDIIGGHCGGNPSPAWIDVTDATSSHGTIGRWTGRGRF